MPEGSFKNPFLMAKSARNINFISIYFQLIEIFPERFSKLVKC